MSTRTQLAKFVKSADGLEIYAEASGDRTKPHVVFIHGFTLSSIVWDAQFHDAKLLDHIYAVRYDLRGHGRTGKPTQAEAWVSKRLADDFDAVVKAFHLEKPILAGWSYGTTIAADVVNAFGPYYLSGIIYLGALAYTPDEHNLLCPMDPVSLMFQDLSLTSEANQQLLTGFMEACWTKPSSIPEETRKSWLNAMLSQPIAARKRATSRTQDKRRFWATAGPVLPLLVIHGQLDKVCPHDALVEEVESRFRRYEIESIPGMGHVPFIEKAAEINEIIIRWLGKTVSC